MCRRGLLAWSGVAGDFCRNLWRGVPVIFHVPTWERFQHVRAILGGKVFGQMYRLAFSVNRKSIAGTPRFLLDLHLGPFGWLGWSGFGNVRTPIWDSGQRVLACLGHVKSPSDRLLKWSFGWFWMGFWIYYVLHICSEYMFYDFTYLYVLPPSWDDDPTPAGPSRDAQWWSLFS